MGELKKNQQKAFDNAIKLTNNQEKQLVKIYQRSLKNIRNELLKLNEKITWSFQELNKYDRLKKLEDQIFKELKNISKESYKIAVKNNTLIVNDSYNRSWFGYTKELSAFVAFGKINPDLVKQIVLEPYPGVKLVDLIKNVNATDINKIRLEIGQGLLQGEGVQKIARRIRDILNISLNRANRIVRTEALSAQSKALELSNQKAKEQGIEIRELWDATLDSRTRQTHRSADGKVKNKDGDFIVGGVKFTSPRIVSPRNTSGNTARERINCRCSMFTEIEDVPETLKTRAKKQSKRIDGLTYEEWLKGL